jgi:hypothetical protein
VLGAVPALIAPPLAPWLLTTLLPTRSLARRSLAAPQENVRLSPAMLSRFDLSFVLLDRADELLDQALSEHVMALHSGARCPPGGGRARLLRVARGVPQPGPDADRPPCRCVCACSHAP